MARTQFSWHAVSVDCTKLQAQSSNDTKIRCSRYSYCNPALKGNGDNLKGEGLMMIYNTPQMNSRNSCWVWKPSEWSQVRTVFKGLVEKGVFTWASKMGQVRLAQQEKAFADEFDVLCSISRTLTVERIHFPELSSDLHTCTVACTWKYELWWFEWEQPL